MQNSDFRDFLTGNNSRHNGKQANSQLASAEMSPSALSNYNLMPRAIHAKKRKVVTGDSEKPNASRSPDADSDYRNRASERRRGLPSVDHLETLEENTVPQVGKPVVGLDYDLLNKVRSEMQKSTEDELEKVGIVEPKAKFSRDELLATLKKSRPSDEPVPVSRFKPIAQPKKKKKRKGKKEKVEVISQKDEKEEKSMTPLSEPEVNPAPASPTPPFPIDEDKGIFSDVEEYKLGQSDSESDQGDVTASAPLALLTPGKYFADDPQDAAHDESSDIIKGVLQRVKEERIRAEKTKEATVGVRKPLPIQEMDKGTEDSYEYDMSGLATGDLRELGIGTKASLDASKSKKAPRKERRKDAKANAKLDREHAELEKFMQKDA